MSEEAPRARMTGAEARSAAAWIAFAPVIFQAAWAMRELGILRVLLDHRAGLTEQEVADRCDISRYGASVLLCMGASAGIVTRDDDRFRPTRVARMLEVDELTRVNVDFVQDVCYAGMASLVEAIREGRPAGLHTLGTDHATFYEALSHLSPRIRRSWFAFDHHYSDASFDRCLDLILARQPKHLLDIGGNTGRFARRCLDRDPDIRLTLVDLPGQLEDAAKTLADDADRVTLAPRNLLALDETLPSGADAVWLSQVLDCFSEPEVVTILRKSREALSERGEIWILEPLWDRQRYEAAEMSLNAGSLYFTTIANGNSRFYDLGTLTRLVEHADLKVHEVVDHLGTGHTLMRVGR